MIVKYHTRGGTMIQSKQADGSLKGEARGERVAGTPFAVVPVSGTDDTEGGR